MTIRNDKMRKKPELLATARSLDECERVIYSGADAVVIGHSNYGMRLSGDFDLEQIRQAVTIAHHKQVKVYVSVNKIFANEELEDLRDYMCHVQESGADALIFGDPAVLMAYRDLGMDLSLHWNAEMTSTNYATANYWGAKGAGRAVLARELNLEEIQEIVRNTELEVEIQVHGITNIYHSKRRLVDSYLAHQAETLTPIPDNTGKQSGLYLIEEERGDLHIPIYQDQGGTHIMSADDICLIDALDELLTAEISSLKIEGLMKSEDCHACVVNCYREAIDHYFENPETYLFREEWLDRIRKLQHPYRELSYGFLFKEQVY